MTARDQEFLTVCDTVAATFEALAKFERRKEEEAIHHKKTKQHQEKGDEKSGTMWKKKARELKCIRQDVPE